MRVQDKPKHPLFLGMSLCHKQNVSGHYCRTAALSGKVTSGLSPDMPFMKLSNKSLPPTNALENLYQIVLA